MWRDCKRWDSIDKRQDWRVKKFRAGETPEEAIRAGTNQFAPCVCSRHLAIFQRATGTYQNKVLYKYLADLIAKLIAQYSQHPDFDIQDQDGGLINGK